MRSSRNAGALAVLALSLSAVPSPSWAGQPRPIRFDRLSLEQGLSQSAVMDVLQDRRGYIWLATEDGLNRYDGTRVQGLQARRGRRQLAAGQLRVGRRGGRRRQPLDRHPQRPRAWDPATDRIVRQESVRRRGTSAPCDHSRRTTCSGSRPATRASSASTSPPGQLKPFAHDARDAASLLDDHVYALPIDAQDRLWVGTEGGLDRLNADGKGFTHFAPNAADPASLSDAKVAPSSPTTPAPSGSGTSAGGLDRLDLATGRFEHFRHDAADADEPGQRPGARASCRTPTAGSGSARAAAWTSSTPRTAPSPTTPGRRQPVEPRRRPRPLARPGPRRRALGGDAPWAACTSGTR